MRYIEYEKIVETVKELCIRACHELPDDVLAAIASAEKKESNPKAAGPSIVGDGIAYEIEPPAVH